MLYNLTISLFTTFLHAEAVKKINGFVVYISHTFLLTYKNIS